ncbi:MAG: M48 family metalloprotease [Pseudomonadota bacterium]
MGRTTRRALAPLLLAALLGGCGTNPVTGRNELQFVGEAKEIQLGTQNYLPARQMQGGDYVIEPELTAYLQEVGARLAKVSDRPHLPYEFVVLNNSVPNAWAMPGGKIAFNRGLLTEMSSEAELAAVMGHEIVHAAARHGAKNIERGTLLQVGLLALQVSQIDNRYGALVVNSGAVAAQLLSQKFGRNAELESDLYGMRYMKEAGYDPSAAVDLQETFVRLSEGRKSDWLTGLFSSHPPSQTRVAKNQETLAELGAGGDYGRQRYAQKISGLLRNKPAYEAYDEGVKAMQEGQHEDAARLARKAMKIEPREAKFYGLFGDTRLQAKDYPGAIRYYEDAIERNPKYFQPYLTRGIAYRGAGDNPQAQRDFKRSIELLPTATAYHGLGMIALDQGNRKQAVAYLEQAAQSQSGVGKEARATLARLDPARFIATRTGADNAGKVLVQVANQAAVPVGRIQLEVSVLDPSGRRVQSRKTVSVRDWIDAGANTVVDTGLGPITDRSDLQRVRVAVRAAVALDDERRAGARP